MPRSITITEMPPDRLNADNVLPLVSTKALGRSLYRYLTITGSTNDDARRLGERGAPHGTIVVADGQTQGKGRHDRPWVSPFAQGIYATLLLRPPGFAQTDTTLIPLLAAVAAAEAIESTAGELTPAIKWPNDILVNEHKVAGVLAEAAYTSENLNFIVVGIGINVNTPTSALPVRPLYPASSLAIEAGHLISRAALLAAWINRFEHWLLRLCNGEQAAVRNQWSHFATITNRRVTVRDSNGIICGSVEGISDDGALLIRTDEGKQVHILSGDVGVEEGYSTGGKSKCVSNKSTSS